MLVGSIILSALTGVVAMVATMALSMPVWVTLAAYPVICSLTLLLSAALWNIRTSHGDKDERLARLQPQPQTSYR